MNSTAKKLILYAMWDTAHGCGDGAVKANLTCVKLGRLSGGPAKKIQGYNMIQYDTIWYNQRVLPLHSLSTYLVGLGDLKRHELPGWSFLDNVFVDSFYERSRCFDPGCDDPLCTTHHSSSLELAGLAVGVQNPIGSPLNRRSVSVFQCIVTGFLLWCALAARNWERPIHQCRR